MALFVDLAALSNGLHGSVQMDSVALFLWIGWLRHHGILKQGRSKRKWSGINKYPPLWNRFRKAINSLDLPELR